MAPKHHEGARSRLQHSFWHPSCRAKKRASSSYDNDRRDTPSPHEGKEPGACGAWWVRTASVDRISWAGPYSRSSAGNRIGGNATAIEVTAGGLSGESRVA